MENASRSFQDHIHTLLQPMLQESVTSDPINLSIQLAGIERAEAHAYGVCQHIALTNSV